MLVRGKTLLNNFIFRIAVEILRNLDLLIFLQYTLYMTSIKRLYYYVMCVSAFSMSKNLDQKDAYNYLEKYKGIDFLDECYDAEHCLSIDNAVDDLTVICKNNGGSVS